MLSFERSKSSQNVKRARAAGLVMILGSLAMTGCDRTAPLAASHKATESGVVGEPSFAQFSDVPVPAGAKMDLDRSLVLGDREAWIGRLVMAVGMNQDRAYDFYFGEMPRFGWLPVTTVRSETSVLTYTRGTRVATVQIQGRPITGARIWMTISPKGSLTGRADSNLYAPVRAVQSTPLR
jgi:hypothetical protein